MTWMQILNSLLGLLLFIVIFTTICLLMMAVVWWVFKTDMDIDIESEKWEEEQ